LNKKKKKKKRDPSFRFLPHSDKKMSELKKEPQSDYQAAPSDIQPVVGQPVPLAVPAPGAPQVSIKNGEWEEDLFGCFSSCVPNCCMVTFCPCVSLGQIAARIGVADYITILLISLIGMCFTGSLVIFVLVWYLRSKVRDRFKIPGSCLGDCCTSCCCTCCAVAQMATHVKSYTPGSCSFGPPDVLPAYNDSPV
jgi:Cys-rich protein (TIGR01571 family)